MPPALFITMDPRDPNLPKIRDIARGSREGKIVAFPTETVYGIGGPMSCRGLSQKLIELKGRDPGKPFSFHIADWEMVDFLGVHRTPQFRFLARKYWPGPLTLLMPNEEGETVGLRFPNNRLAMTLIQATGEPFIATSANPSGEQSPYSAEDVRKHFEDKIDFIIDGGESDFKADSTIVDLTGDEPKMIREGADAEEIKKDIEKIKSGNYPRKRVLVVCTGNSCRSPMAEGWLKAELEAKDLGEKIEVSSCGVGTRDGRPATPEAVFVMKNREIDISDHRSKVITREDVMESDVILAMSKEHYTFITSLLPQAKSKTRVFNIFDPIGSSINVYEDVMNEIEKELDNCWDWIVE